MATFTCKFSRTWWGNSAVKPWEETETLTIQAEPDGEDYQPVDDAAWAEFWKTDRGTYPRVSSWSVEIREER